MGISEILGLLGGLALFLHGMQMMSSGLEAAAGNRMKNILERLTANRFLGVLVGAAITLMIPGALTDVIGVVLMAACVITAVTLSKRQTPKIQ